MNIDIEKYENQNMKKMDFVIGFILNIFIGACHFGLYWVAYIIVESFFCSDVNMIVTIMLIVLISLVEWFTIRYFFKCRKYISIGMLASLLLPLLVTGFCSIMFNETFEM